MAESVKLSPADTAVVRTRDNCRLCKGTELERVWSFGPTPLANSYLLPEEVGQPEVVVALDVYYCRDCHLMQLREVIDPDVMFRDYLYVSSTSPTFVAHFESLAHALIDRFKLTDDDLVVDVGSNDGVLLKPLQEAGVQVLGIDPAEDIAAEATTKGLETWPKFFTAEVARQIVKEKRAAKVITANNVFAHTDDIDVFVEAVKELLAEDGVFVFEVQYLGDLVAKNLFDIVYHEHVNYYHLTPLVQYFAEQGMEVFDVERLPVHGGSLRVYVKSKKNSSYQLNKRVDELLAQEAQDGLNESAVYRRFADRITENKDKLRALLTQIKTENKRVVGFGAPAKATTLMHVFGLSGDDIDCIIDDAPLKQGRVMPGTHVPIVAAEKLYEDNVDYCLILAWNFAEPIMKNHKRFKDQGGKFIIPMPEPHII